MFNRIKQYVSIASIGSKWISTTGVNLNDKGQVAARALHHLDAGYSPPDAWVISVTEWTGNVPWRESQLLLCLGILRFLEDNRRPLDISDEVANTVREIAQDIWGSDPIFQEQTGVKTNYSADESGHRIRFYSADKRTKISLNPAIDEVAAKPRVTTPAPSPALVPDRKTPYEGSLRERTAKLLTEFEAQVNSTDESTDHEKGLSLDKYCHGCGTKVAINTSTMEGICPKCGRLVVLC